MNTACEKCGRKKIALFFSVVCDNCEPYSCESDKFGYVVWRERSGHCEYIFQTLDHAEQWRAGAQLERFPIRKVVRKTGTFRWRDSTGSVKGIKLADRLHEIFATPDYEE